MIDDFDSGFFLNPTFQPRGFGTGGWGLTARLEFIYFLHVVRLLGFCWKKSKTSNFLAWQRWGAGRPTTLVWRNSKPVCLSHTRNIKPPGTDWLCQKHVCGTGAGNRRVRNLHDEYVKVSELHRTVNNGSICFASSSGFLSRGGCSQ